MRVVPRLDEVEDCGFGVALRAETMLHEQLAFERRVEAFAHRVDRLCQYDGETTLRSRDELRRSDSGLREADNKQSWPVVALMNASQNERIFPHFASFRNMFSRHAGHCGSELWRLREAID
jgi:hypothetical protein